MEHEGLKIHRGNASQFYVAAELSRRNVIAAITLGNCPSTDVLCTRPDGEGFVHVQVKTFRKGGRSCSVGMKAEKDRGDNFFWVLVGIPRTGDDSPVFFVIPSTEMAKHVKKCHQLWLKAPGRNGQPHNDNSIRSVRINRENRDEWRIDLYKGRWDLIETKLGMEPHRNLDLISEEADEPDDDSP
jgi:hypothetical protein